MTKQQNRNPDQQSQNPGQQRPKSPGSRAVVRNPDSSSRTIRCARAIAPASSRAASTARNSEFGAQEQEAPPRGGAFSLFRGGSQSRSRNDHLCEGS